MATTRKKTEPQGPPDPSAPSTRVIIEVNGGCVSGVHSTDPNLRVSILDWDNVKVDEEARKEAEALESEIADMTEIAC